MFFRLTLLSSLLSILTLSVGCAGADQTVVDPEQPSEPSVDCDAAPLHGEDDENCHYVLDDRCFETADDACFCAACETECLIMETYPNQVRCL